MEAIHGNQPESPPRLISTKAAADLLGLQPDTIRRLIRAGRIEAYQLSEAGRLRIPVSALNEYISSRKVTRGPR